MGYHGRFEAAKPKKKKRGLKITMIIVAILLVLVVGAVIAGVMYYNSILNNFNHVEVPKIQYTTQATEPTDAVSTTAAEAEATEEATVETTEPAHVPSSEDYINILVVGQASRAGESKDSERMADTAILCTINKYEKKLTLTSFLRDALVRPPDFKGHTFGKIKLTTVYHLGSYYSNGDIAGSMQLMNMTLYDSFGIEVDYNVEVDFDALIKAIDVLGGVSIELTQEEANYMNDPAQDAWVGYDVQPGWNWLDGSGALCYARMRKAEGDADSDIKRTARQRQLINQVVRCAKDIVVNFSLSKVQELATEVLPYITTSMTNQEMTNLMMELLPMLPDLKVETGGTCPVEGTARGAEVDIYGDGMYHSVMIIESFEQQKKLMRAITEGEVAN